MKLNKLDTYSRIGFMQGRLAPMVDGKIQAFPWCYWHEEFVVAQKLGLKLMEWTIDRDRLYQNPLMRKDGRKALRALMEKFELSIPSLTGDCFMQAPFWKAEGPKRDKLLHDFEAVVEACGSFGLEFVVVPLVDNGRLEGRVQEDNLAKILGDITARLSVQAVKVVFECDYKPSELARLMDRFDSSVFGINYDIGNSAALGFDPHEELHCYGERILNVHVKDRLFGAGTVPLGEGNADFEKVFTWLGKIGYRGNYIMQTARASDGRHAAALDKYRKMIAGWIERYDA